MAANPAIRPDGTALSRLALAPPQVWGTLPAFVLAETTRTRKQGAGRQHSRNFMETRLRQSMPEMPYPGEHHGQAQPVGGVDRFLVTH